MRPEGTVTAPAAELGAAFQEYYSGNDTFIGDKVFVPFLSGKRDGVFNALTRESLVQSLNPAHAAGADFARTQTVVGEVTFQTRDYGLEEALPKEMIELYASNNSFDAELAAIRSTATKLAIAAEVRIAAKVFNTTTFAGADLYKDWSAAPWDAAASDIPAHIQNAVAKVRTNSGVKPDTLVVGETTFQNMLANTKILARFPGAMAVTADMMQANMATLFGLKKLYVGSGISAIGTDIWSDDYAMVCKTADSTLDLSEPALGRNIYWDKFGTEQFGWVEPYADPRSDSMVYRVRNFVDNLLIDKYFGFLMKVDA